jgi:hypothetical protein
MKNNIALYCLPRAGSTSLYDCISEHLGKDYLKIWEPFNPNNQIFMKEMDSYKKLFEGINNNQKLFLKLMAGQRNPWIKQSTWDSYIFENVPKIIFLTREDKVAAAESLLFNQTDLENGFHSKRYYDISKIDKIELEMRVLVNELQDKYMKLYSREYGYPIFTYEEIFVQKNMKRIYEIFDYFEIVPQQELIDKWIISDEYKIRLGNVEDKPKNKIL